LLAEISQRDAVAMLCRAAAADSALREITAWAVEQAAAVDPQGRLHVPALRLLPEALQAAVVADYLAIHGAAGIGKNAVERCLGMLAEGGPAAVDLPGGLRLRRRAGRLFFDA
jgi:hypothetical protein